MTLIITALSEQAICTVTDTYLTNGTGAVVDSDAVKSMKLECGDGYFMFSFTGKAFIDGEHTMNWITDVIARLGVGDKGLDEIALELAARLEQQFSGYFRNVPALVIVVAGWKRINRRLVPKLYMISNVEGSDGQEKITTSFKYVEAALKSRRPTKLVIRGTMSATKSDRFINLQHEIESLLKVRASSFEAIRDKLAQLIVLASSDPRSAGKIGNKVMASTITRLPNPLAYRHYPETASYTTPNLVNGGMAMRGGKIQNDPLNGGTIQLGAHWSGKNWGSKGPTLST